MTARAVRAAAAAAGLALSAGTASAEGEWVLWTESPAGSDLWSAVQIGQTRFNSAEDCQRRAQALNDLEEAFARMERADVHDVFACLPDRVDPRPEGALMLDKVDPRGPKGGVR